VVDSIEKEPDMQTSDISKATLQLQGFEDFVRTTMQDWKLQGLAIAIVKDGEVISSKGFGLRDAASGLEVTPQTLFPIASCTKAFTTTAMAILVDEGKLDWDTPVRSYIPTFKLYDPFTTERITPRDLVTHRSGLPRHDLVWYNSSASRRQLFDRLQYLEPSKDFRAVWQYQNLMYMAAGYLIQQITGQTWEEFVQQRIFDPLGMASSNFSIVETAEKATDFSHPYREEKDEVKEIPFYAAQGAIGPAGAIVSNISDMSKWVLLQLNKGKYGDTQIVSEAQLAQLHFPQMVIPETSNYTEIAYSSYGMGWAVTTYRGHPMINHSGGIDGFSTLTTFFPQDAIGIVVLANMGGTPISGILTFNAFDRLLGMDEVPWSERSKKEREEFKAASEKGKEKSETDRVPGTTPSHPLDAYTGDFEHPGYGTLSVQLDGDQLQITYNSMVFPLKHYHYDIFEFTLEKWEMNFKVSFLTNVKGDIDTLTAPLEPTVKDIVFKRAVRKEMTEQSFLEQFVGIYEVMSMNMTVALKGEHTLSASISGQPEQELVPYKGTEFQLKGLSGFSVEFKKDDSGKVTEATVTMPYGVFTAKKK